MNSITPSALAGFPDQLEAHYAAIPAEFKHSPPAGRDGLDLPGWMFDRATCAAMPLADHPTVGIKHLRALRDLLISAAGTRDENLIETQHLDSSRKGDAIRSEERR